MKTYDDPAAFVADLRRAQRSEAVKRRKRPRQGAALPRRTSERTGLAALISRGWRQEWRDGGMRLARGGVATAWGTERDVCREAKKLETTPRAPGIAQEALR